MNRLKTRFNIIRATDKITISYQLIMILLICITFVKIDYASIWILLHMFIIIWLLKIPDLTNNRFLNWISFWNPVLILAINFTELHYLINKVNPKDLDNLLIKVDYFMFGVHPTLWLERFTTPALTEYFQLSYTLFYFLPFVLIVLLLKNKNNSKAEFFMFTLVYGFYFSYIGYFLVPALGPRFTLDHLQSFPLQGIWVTEAIRKVLDLLENIQRDAFPSGHVEITVLTMYYAYKYNKKYFSFLTIAGTSLILSTVYLRYHYVADTIGGFVFAGIVILTAEMFYKSLRARV